MLVEGMFRRRKHIPLSNEELGNVVGIVFIEIVRKIYKGFQLFFIANCNNFSQSIYVFSGQTALRFLLQADIDGFLLYFFVGSSNFINRFFNLLERMGSHQ